MGPRVDDSTVADASQPSKLAAILGLIRFSHTLFAMPFAILSAILAWHTTDATFRWIDLVGIVLCMVFARSAAMAFNRLVDADIDSGNPRTESRHIPAGLLSRRYVAAFTVLCSLGFVATTALFLPKVMPLVLSVPVLLFLLGYSYAKRWTSLCHYWLSAALMLSPIAAWIAVTDTVGLPSVLLALVVFFWVGGFDIIYACQDEGFDRDAGLRSIPARLGTKRALQVAKLSHLLTIFALFALWHFSSLGTVFLIAVCLISVLLIYEHSIVSADDLTRVNIAFFQVNSIISVGILLAGGIDLIVGV